jgi:hypothetical protein
MVGFEPGSSVYEANVMSTALKFYPHLLIALVYNSTELDNDMNHFKRGKD